MPPPFATGRRLAGGSACLTKTQAIAHQSGTDAFVCQPCGRSDFFRFSGSGAHPANSAPRRSRPGYFTGSSSVLLFTPLITSWKLAFAPRGTLLSRRNSTASTPIFPGSAYALSTVSVLAPTCAETGSTTTYGGVAGTANPKGRAGVVGPKPVP